MGQVQKVVIDTNVLISGFGWDGKPEAVLQLLQQGRIHNFISDDIFEELKTVVSYPKIGFSETLRHAILEFAFFIHSLLFPSACLQLSKTTLPIINFRSSPCR